MSEKSWTQESIGIGVTALRLGIAAYMMRQIREERSIDGSMATFLAADVLDGVVLRQYDMDTPTRRVADGVVDQVANAMVALEISRRNPAARPYIGVIAVRGALAGGLNLYHAMKTGEVTKGGTAQRAVNLATALFAVTAAASNKNRTIATGLLASGVALATLPHMTKNIGNQKDGKIRQL